MKRRGQEAGDVYLELTFYAALNVKSITNL